MAQLSLQHIQKIYDNQVHVVKDFSLEIADKSSSCLSVRRAAVNRPPCV